MGDIFEIRPRSIQAKFEAINTATKAADLLDIPRAVDLAEIQRTDFFRTLERDWTAEAKRRQFRLLGETH